MLTRIFMILRGVISGALILIGGLVVLLVWWLSGSSKSDSEVAQVAEPVIASCDCTAGATCIGPRGGRYCFRPDGSKAYEARKNKQN